MYYSKKIANKQSCIIYTNHRSITYTQTPNNVEKKQTSELHRESKFNTKMQATLLRRRPKPHFKKNPMAISGPLKTVGYDAIS